MNIKSYKDRTVSGAVPIVPPKLPQTALPKNGWIKEILKDIDTKFTMLEILLQHRNTEIDQNLDKKLGEFEKKIEEKMNNLTNNITEEVPNRINMTWT